MLSFRKNAVEYFYIVISLLSLAFSLYLAGGSVKHNGSFGAGSKKRRRCRQKSTFVMADQLFVEERRRAILDLLKRFGRVAVKDLSENLNVSAVTIRQDLRVLEEDGYLERTYGGAVLRTAATTPEVSFDIRRESNRPEKEAIGRVAAALVQEGYSIALDASTTAYAMTPHLKRLNDLTVVTYSLMVALAFLDAPQVNVIIPGGRLRRDSVSVVGSPSHLPEINLNIGFFSARGFSLDVGLSEANPEQAAIKRGLIAHSLVRVAILDSSKWGQLAPYTYAHIQDFSQMFTTARAPVDMVTAVRDLGVTVTLLPST